VCKAPSVVFLPIWKPQGPAAKPEQLSSDTVLTKTVNSALASGGIQNKVLVDCSTVHPETTAELATKVSDARGEYLAGRCSIHTTI
jgi:hypothetical protein